ncbi:hypothetical protein DFH07DRAFT_959565 [Mycena maculata]|uniref:DUF7605 domain-containing protein n=1 Tax=Mycena maculata TaxID=230809 RepID=A0AAD7J1K3_9AGAR|nr:hypothetical protein DFH07DRAFT_959565 [Mycena maculata]
MDEDFDMESVLTDLDEEETALQFTQHIHNFVVPTVQKLSEQIQRFPNIPAEQHNLWGKTVSRIIKDIPRTYKFAVIGKTGSGKSTLINCILGASILPSSAAGYAGYGVRRSLLIYLFSGLATIVFLSEDEWCQELEKLLNNITSDEGDDSSESPSSRSRERLKEVYPQYRNMSNECLGKLTVTKLLQISSDRLGTSFDLPATDADNLRTNLEEYLSSSHCSGNNAVLWPLVKKYSHEWRSADDSLSYQAASSWSICPDTGTTTMGKHIDPTKYIKNARGLGIILVVDAKRAQNDRDTSTLNSLILRGHSVEENIILAVTGTDTLIGDNEIKLDENSQGRYDRLSKELKEFRQLIRPPKKSKTSKQEDSQQVAEVRTKIREKEQEKALLLANVRISGIREGIQNLFGQIYSDISPEGSKTPTLPVFCLGSRDYFALTSYTTTPLVFATEEETEIPSLTAHMLTIGERRRLRWATRLLDIANTLSEEIHSYFSQGRHPGRLRPENKDKAMALIKELEKANLDEVGDAFDAIAEELVRVQDDLKKSVKKVAAENSPHVIQELGRTVHWQTYKACMRLNGVYCGINLNHVLTQNIQPAMQGSWNGGVNHKIPMTLEQATEKLEDDTLRVVTKIIETLEEQGTVVEQSILTARQSLGIEGILNDMLSSAKEVFNVEKQDGITSCSSILQKALIPHYQAIAQDSGPGAVNRMKTASLAYLRENGAVVFDSINLHIQKVLGDAFAKVRKLMREELQDITTRLRLSLVEEVNLSNSDKEAKDEILQLTLENRPAFATKKQDLAYRRRAQGL